MTVRAVASRPAHALPHGAEILELTDPRWRQFVAAHPAAMPFHHPDWAALVAGCYRFRAFALAIAADPGGDGPGGDGPGGDEPAAGRAGPGGAAAIRAGLPVAEVRHLRGRAKWVSLPFTDYCPPLLRRGADESQLVAALREASTAAGVRRVEVRAPLAVGAPVPFRPADDPAATGPPADPAPGDGAPVTGAPVTGAPVTGAAAAGPEAFRHVLALDSDPAAVYAGFHRSQVQRNIRRAEREGLTVRQGEVEDDVSGVFYWLHLRTRHRQGVPVQPRRFFRQLWDRVIRTGLGSALIVESQGRPVAAAIFLAWNGTVIYKFGASDADAWRLRPNHLLFWHAIRAACEQGYRWFDFGRTEAGHGGLRDFKRSWGAAEEPLGYTTLGGAPEEGTGPAGRLGRALGTAIRHSPPLLCRVTGELLYRYTA